MNQDRNQGQQSSGNQQTGQRSGQTPDPSYQPEQEGSASRQQNAGMDNQQGQQGQQNRGQAQGGSRSGGSQSGNR